jgi:hypothetical protein
VSFDSEIRTALDIELLRISESGQTWDAVAPAGYEVPMRGSRCGKPSVHRLEKDNAAILLLGANQSHMMAVAGGMVDSP